MGGGDDGTWMCDDAGFLRKDGNVWDEFIWRGEGWVISVVVAWDGGTGTLNCVEILSGVKLLLMRVGGGWFGTVRGGDDRICI